MITSGSVRRHLLSQTEFLSVEELHRRCNNSLINEMTSELEYDPGTPPAPNTGQLFRECSSVQRATLWLSLQRRLHFSFSVPNKQPVSAHWCIFVRVHTQAATYADAGT